MLKIAITGGAGRLAQNLYNCLDKDIIDASLLTRKDADITLVSDMYDALNAISPQIVVHCAAMTHPMALHEEQPFHSISANIIGTAGVAYYCCLNNVKIYYISTDWVYQSSSNVKKHLHPERAYGWSKLGGECAANMVPRHTILRAAFCHEPYPHPKAFTDAVKSYMTCTDASTVIAALLKAEYPNLDNPSLDGTFNLGGPTRSIYEFVQAKFPEQHILPISIDDVGEYIPMNTSMDCLPMKRLLKDIAPELVDLVGERQIHQGEK